MAPTRLKDVATHPASLGTSGLLAVLGIYKGSLLWAALATFWAQAGSIFGLSGAVLFASDYLDVPAWVVAVAVVVALAAVLVLVAKGALRFWSGVEARSK